MPWGLSGPGAYLPQRPIYVPKTDDRDPESPNTLKGRLMLKPAISICVPLLAANPSRLRNWRAIANELSALAARRGDVEIIVAEHTHNHAEGYPHFKRVEVPGAFCRSKARNVAWKAATSDRLCFCDSDMVMSPDAWDKAIDEAQRYDCYTPSKQFRKLTAAQTSANIIDGRVQFDKSLRRAKPKPANLSGGIFFCSRQFMVDVNGWDERFRGHGMEDIAINRLARVGGFNVGYGVHVGRPIHLWHANAKPGRSRTRLVYLKFYAGKSFDQIVGPQSAKRVLFFEVSGGHDKWWAPIHRHFVNHGWAIDKVKGKVPQSIDQYDQIVIWNGEQKQDKQLAQMAKAAGIPVTYLEVGYFSQQDHCMITPRGSVGGALLSEVDTLDPITENEEEGLQEFFQQYARGQAPTDGDSVLVPLQLEQDYSIRNYSTFKTMQQLAGAVERQYPTDKIVYRPHPKARGKQIQTRHSVKLTPSIWQQVLNAKEVVGINSTLLYEAALAGKKVTALGDCPLRRFPTQHREVCREVIRRQVPLDYDVLPSFAGQLLGDLSKEACRDDNRNPIHFFWVQGPLSALARLSVASFAGQGYEVNLWTYDTGLASQIPPGVKLRDANEVMPQSNVFAYSQGEGKGSYAGTADIFRVLLLARHGGWYFDTDVTLLKPIPTHLLESPVVLRRHWKLPIVNSVMKFPAGHPAIELAAQRSASSITHRTDWALGMRILGDACKKSGLLPECGHIISHCDESSALVPYVDSDAPFPDDWWCVHWCNERFRRGMQEIKPDSTLARMLKAG